MPACCFPFLPCTAADTADPCWPLSDSCACLLACLIAYPPPACRLNFEGNELWEAFLGLALLVFGYNLVGFLVLRFTKPRFLPLTPAPAKKSL
jgi:hypothetical protein